VQGVVLRHYAESACTTLVIVENHAPTAIDVDIDWYSFAHSFQGSHQATILAARSDCFGVFENGETFSGAPYFGVWIPLAEFQGTAEVHASDPRITVTAFLHCDSVPVDNDPTVVNTLSAQPVGASLQYYMAGMSPDWTPPVAPPEDSE
jgi:hypothetical protein